MKIDQTLQILDYSTFKIQDYWNFGDFIKNLWICPLGYVRGFFHLG
jgi:hypothetical protein